MYFLLEPIDPTTPKGLDQLIENLIFQQYETDLFVWKQIEQFSETPNFLSDVDTYPLCNWRIIYSLLGFKDVPDDLKLFHGHITRRLFEYEITSPFIAFYTDMILDNEDFDDGTADIRTSIQHLIKLIKSYKQ
ncbi:MAG: hypothetical protein HYZ44_13285 [Bacteroidetes bacterium]|nr:hypothetical protein [Bacteroidota bacterium]